MKFNAKILQIDGVNNPSLSASNPKPLSGKGFKKFLLKTEHSNGTHRRAGKLDTFTIPQIVPSNYREQPLDNQSEWCIFFRYRPAPGQRMKGIKKRIDLNSYRGKEKIKRAEFLRKMTHEALKQGANPIEEEEENVYGYLGKMIIRRAFCIVFTDELFKWSEKTLSSYLSSATRFSEFLTFKKWENKYINEFNRSMAKSYSDYLLSKGYDITTHNNHLRYAGTFFGYFVEREVIEVNPFSRVKKLRDKSGGQLPFSPDQLKELRSKLDRPALLFLDFAIDSLMRTGELERMKVSWIRDKEIAIVNNPKSGQRTKDGQTRYVKISPEIMKRMKSLVEGCDPDDFVFGAGFKPTKKQLKKDHLSKVFTELIRPLGFGEAYTLYSCRKTGSIQKWKIDRWSAEELMNQLGHENFDVTMKYLRDILGVYNR